MRTKLLQNHDGKILDLKMFGFIIKDRENFLKFLLL